MKHRGWIVCSGLIWALAGASLFYKGTQLTSGWLVAFGLLIGLLKGQFVLAKTARRVVARIHGLSLPIAFSQVYTPAYWMLIAGMMSLGVLFRVLSIPADIRGVIDVGVGSALMHGATFYFRAARGFVTD